MKYYVVDVFTDKIFSGNPAGVCILDNWCDDAVMQSIAAENNLSETAFAVKDKYAGFYHLRWFTPTTEVDLCGHATIACGYVLLNFYHTASAKIDFYTLSGIMTVTKDNDTYLLDFPSRPAQEIPTPVAIKKALNVEIIKTLKAIDLLVILKNENEVKNLKPDLTELKRVKEELSLTTDSFGVIVSAKANPSLDYHFVSRFFAPNAGIDEDPVTGRAHCTLIPYWSQVIEKDIMQAKQLSKRGGDIYCVNNGERVKIGAKTALYMIGEINI